jgi:hypothetical protein
MGIVNKVQLLINGHPSDLIKELDGRIWEKSISKQELKNYSENYKIIHPHKRR